ncbi:hypothetical protein KQI74_23465 [Paenibacillus barcinonensis]|jgi:hypothetical protein|uniref:hypothetical protein n=1 Tax=Paenibacillus barcinonensis TaxID=198119 RepID=UPI001C11752F|nr:hypothetical protein [Paenibacillus barcinonensis]MBU5355219.1 hypothetical protein [Paenibacillus barcinonensis]MDM5280465.1 hypothetical protein [Paenibacillus silvae]
MRQEMNWIEDEVNLCVSLHVNQQHTKELFIVLFQLYKLLRQRAATYKIAALFWE